MSQGNSYKNPPRLKEEKDYDIWRNEISMWALLTDIDKKKQALAVVLSFEENSRYRDSALTLSTAELNVDHVLEKLLAFLDKEFRKNVIDRSYAAFLEFEECRLVDGSSMTEYINSFEMKYKKASAYDMKLPDAVLAFKVLENTGLNQTEKRLILTAVKELKFEEVKSALKRIYGESNPLESKLKVKSEPAYSTTEQEFPTFYTNGQNNSRWNKQRNAAVGRELKGTNPLRRDGTISTCSSCGSRYHWYKDCPEKMRTRDQKEQENVGSKYALLTSQVNNFRDLEGS